MKLQLNFVYPYNDDKCLNVLYTDLTIAQIIYYHYKQITPILLKVSKGDFNKNKQLDIY